MTQFQHLWHQRHFGRESGNILRFICRLQNSFSQKQLHKQDLNKHSINIHTNMEVGKKIHMFPPLGKELQATNDSQKRERYLLPAMRPLSWLTNTNTQINSYMSNTQTKKKELRKLQLYMNAQMCAHTHLCVFVRLKIKDKNDVNLRVGYLGSITERRIMWSLLWGAKKRRK